MGLLQWFRDFLGLSKYFYYHPFELRNNNKLEQPIMVTAKQSPFYHALRFKRNKKGKTIAF